MNYWPMFLCLVLSIAIHRETRVAQLDATAPRMRELYWVIMKFSFAMSIPWTVIGELAKLPSWFSPVTILALVWGMLMVCNENALRSKS